jgi:transposase-like protein
MRKYGIPSLKRDFPNHDACLQYIFNMRHARKCSCGGEYSLMKEGLKMKRKFQCGKCRFQISPTAGTIFNKSKTPLLLWFHAILAFSNAKSGISAQHIQRNLEVTYKCAYRILDKIRKSLKQDAIKLKGDVEIDTGYFGGKGYAGKDNEYLSRVMAKKSVVIVAIERGGRARAEIVPDSTSKTMTEFIKRNVQPKTTSVLTDGSKAYLKSERTYDRYFVDHHKGEYVRGDIHINTVETFFAHLKRSIRGTFKSLSRRHLQFYLDAFVFHYNNRHNDKERFSLLLGMLLRSSKQQEIAI